MATRSRPFRADPVARHFALFGSVALAGLALATCNPREVSRARAVPRHGPAEAPPPAATPAASLAPVAPFAPFAPFAPEGPLACATLRDVAVSDVVRVDGKTLDYADATAGLIIVDASDAAHPRALAVVPFVGNPLALFVREGLAWLSYVDPDARSGTTASPPSFARSTSVTRAIRGSSANRPAPAPRTTPSSSAASFICSGVAGRAIRSSRCSA